MAATERQARARARGAGLRFGPGPAPGPANAITDVPGVEVGQVTLWEGSDAAAIRSGVTAILPHPRNLFREKVTAAVHAINGFGKPTGWAQVRELGNLETPIVLTTTLSVGEAFTALVRHTRSQNPGIGGVAGSVNPIVAECNDGDLNFGEELPVTADHVLEAIAAARGGAVEEGAVGAGTGMTCYGWKGGIGTASRRVEAAGHAFTIGALVLANFGRPADLTVLGTPVGRRLGRGEADSLSEAAGSIVCVLATDAPFDSRQLGRLARRAQNGIARTGGDCEHGSGEFAIAFSTTHSYGGEGWLDLPELINPSFRAVAAVVEESILNALFTAVTVTGRDGTTVEELPAEAVLGLVGERRGSAGAEEGAR